MKKRISVLAVALVLPLFGGAVQAQVPSVDARVTLNIADKSLEEIVKSLRDRSGSNIVIIDAVDKPKISTAKVSIEVFDVGWRDALELVAEKAGCVVEDRPGGVLAVTKPPEVTIEFQDQDVRKVIETIAAVSGASITLGKEVSGNITVRFKDVPWRVALDVTAKTLGFVVVEEKRGVLRIVSPDTLKDQLDTHTYQLRYLRPQSVYKPLIKSEFLQPLAQQQQSTQGKGGGIDYTKTFTVLQSLEKALSAQGKLDYVDITNVIIVRDTAQVHATIKDMLSRLDVEPAQVFSDVKFVSTTNTDLLNLGVDYGDAGPQVTLSGGSIPVTFPFNAGKGGFEDALIANTTGYGPFVDPTLNAGNTSIPDTVFGSLSFTEVTATLRLLQRDTKSEVIQAPKIFTLDGNAGTIFVGETIRYAEAKSEQGQAGGLQLSVAEASGSPVEVGFQLLVRPNVIPGTEKMVMEVIPKETSLSGTGVSSFAPAGFDVFTVGAGGSAGSIALPRTRSSTIVTSMIIESGHTVMIGGLSTEADTQTNSKVPLLGDIPIIGELFKHRSKNRERRSLLVFLTPTIVRSSEDSQRVLEQELTRRRGALHKELEALYGSHPGTSAPKEPESGAQN